MAPLLTNILLALVWIAMTGGMTVGNFFLGFAIGYVILLFQQQVVGQSSYYRKVNQFIAFLLYFLKEMVLATMRVTHDVFTPSDYARPAILAMPLDAKTDFEITLLSNAISLTPGTLSLDVSEDRSTLYIHAMFVDDADALIRDLKEGMERRLMELMR